MDRQTYALLEGYMHTCMEDSAHDREHVYRVLYAALDIARAEGGADMDVLVAACLLHDIGRKEQFEDGTLCHAKVGAEKARTFLLERGFGAEFAEHVAACIRTHRFRKDSPPESIEAKILFDADKLDVAGTMGVARTLLYNGRMGEPLYSLTADGTVSDGAGDAEPSFFQEYKFKLEKLYGAFLTQRGRELALARREGAERFYRSLLAEVTDTADLGRELLKDLLE